MRARLPDDQGHIDLEGVRIGWERYGDSGPSILLLPTWMIVSARVWKGQVAHLARRHRVVVFDGPGNGRSDRALDPAAYGQPRLVDAALAVMDETDTEAAVLVSTSNGAETSIRLAHQAPARVRGQVLLGPSASVTDSPPEDPEDPEPFTEWDDLETDYPRFVERFFAAVVPEPHSTKHIEDGIGWALDTTPEVHAAEGASAELDAAPATVRAWCESIDSPSLVVVGTDDRIIPPSQQRALAGVLDAELVELQGCGHSVARWPVVVNRLIEQFVATLGPDDDGRPAGRAGAGLTSPMCSPEQDASVNASSAHSAWTPRVRRRPRALYLSSPIGLGHANRDLAIARELRRLREDLEIDWLSQDPVTGVLERAGERVHPASQWLANESAHITQEAHDHGAHGLHVFGAFRRMDEIMLANFMVFQEVVEEGAYDLVIGDEAWDVDHFWHEHPELKRGAHVWLTDFVGFVPMESGGDREAFLTADYNAEMVELVAASPRLRDRSVFVGNPDDVITDPLGPGLPSTRTWTEDHFDFSGYITGFTPPTADAVPAVRAELGYRHDERVCIVAVGGSGVGEPVLRRAIEAFALAQQRVDDLRMVVVAGPRIDPSTLPDHDGVEVRGYVPALHRHLSVCDLAIVQGGLTTTMELTAAKRPFISFPLADHFEQQVHVRHRLDRYRAGHTMDFASTDADALADAMVKQLDADTDYRDVETDGAIRAAKLISDLI